MKKIFFFAPRYHTNQIPVVKALLNADFKIEFFVKYKGGSEEHSLLKPNILKESKMSYFLPKSIFVPSISQIMYILKKKPNIIIVRDLNLFSISVLFVSVFFNKNIVKILYTQKPVYTLKNNKKGFKNLIYSIFYKIYNTYSPVLFEKYCEDNVENKYYKNKISFIPFIPEIPAHELSRNYLNGNKINILDVGKYREYKNHYILVDAFYYLSDIQKDEFIITIIGEANNQEEIKYFNELKNYIEKKGLNHYIHLYKNIDYKNMSEYYLKNDVFILTSKNEVASIAIIESMIHGMVPVSTSNNGTATYIDSKSGYIFKSEDVESLLNTLTLLISIKKELPKKGQLSYEHIKSNYNEIHFLKKFNDLLN